MQQKTPAGKAKEINRKNTKLDHMKPGFVFFFFFFIFNSLTKSLLGKSFFFFFGGGGNFLSKSKEKMGLEPMYYLFLPIYLFNPICEVKSASNVYMKTPLEG